jgi:hypothetical protein
MPRSDAAEALPLRSADDAGDDEPASESAQIWEHVKTLRRRVAGFN